MVYIDFTAAELRQFSPGMKPFYRDMLLSSTGKGYLRRSGILNNGQRFCHFIGQFGGETGGGTILREDMTYKSVERIRKVWPARSSKYSDAELQKLVRNPVGLADWAYGGRMGNAKGTRDGHDYRGGGWLQTTGKEAVAKYCAKVGVALRSDILDDPDATLQFACFEWEESGCNRFADENDILALSKVINTGSAKSSQVPNGMAHRQAWFDKACAIWWDAEPVEETQSISVIQAHEIPEIDSATPKATVAPVPAPARGGMFESWSFSKLNELADQGSRLAVHIRALKTWVWGILTTLWAAATMIDPAKGNGSVIGGWIATHPILAAAILGTVIAVILYALAKLTEKYLLTASNSGRYQPREIKP